MMKMLALLLLVGFSLNASAMDSTVITARGSSICTFPDGTCNGITNARGRKDLSFEDAAKNAEIKCSAARGVVVTSAVRKSKDCHKNFDLHVVVCITDVTVDCLTQ